MQKLILQDKEWKETRKTVVTATEAACVIGVNPWRSAQQMYREKLKSTFVPNSYVFIGQLLEPIVCELTNFALGQEFKLYETNEGKPFYIADTARLGATPDATDGHALLECKTTKPYNQIRWSVSPPKYYIIQLLVQMMCTEKEVGYLSILGTNLTQTSETLTLPLSIFKVCRDKGLEKLLTSELARFWETVESGKNFRVNSKVKKLANIIIPTIYSKIL